MFCNINRQKGGREFGFKGNKAFLCGTDLNYGMNKDVQNHGLGYEMYDLWRGSCLGIPFSF